ncbi:helix-turn-helix domain-containing protein [Xanthomarina sp. GH4-25]|uniref:helix-turn-helix domain-containing protein n=1 Tax=Xanthomarina sp. GH4-25 TaxID=3349335 RepID=UPI003877BBC1
MFLDQINTIVQEHISDEKFGVNDLASQLGLSNSQTLRKVKAATGKSVNQYIREFRLEEAARLIKNTDDTIAEISYKVGFRSPSYFNTTFSKHFGVAPGEYKTQPDKTIGALDKVTPIKAYGINSKKPILYTLVAILVAIFGYFIINKSFPKNSSLSNSIAVLPFKDLSPENNQWFCDGVSDNILHSLAQMNDLTVTSFTSSSTYRGSDKQIPEIAKELGVSYILEGSVVLHEGNIKIIAQLIDSNDKHVWSKEYNESFNDIISIQNNVALEVMKQLKNTLNPEEETILKKYPTDNMEAYSFYLKGLNINGIEKKDFELRIEMNKKAIVLDSNFSQAFSNVGYAYHALSHRHFETVDIVDFREKSRYYIDKALQLDTKNDVAWLTKAMLSMYSDWDQTKIYLDEAISINPNNPRTQTGIAIYFVLGPLNNRDLKKALKALRIAYQLDPLSAVASLNLLEGLIKNKLLEEAQTHLEKVTFLIDEYKIHLYLNEVTALKNKDWTSVIPISKSKIEAHPENAIYHLGLAQDYDEILNDKINAIKYAKQAYALDSTLVAQYVDLLIKYEEFKEAHSQMQTNTYKSTVSKRTLLNQLWFYNYSQKNYSAALEVLKDSLYTNHYLRHTYTYAQMGNRKKVDSMNKVYPWGTGGIADWYRHKANIHAALKDRDSMYYYLEQMLINYEILMLNSNKDVDPYRNEARYKAFLRKNYLPVLND